MESENDEEERGKFKHESTQLYITMPSKNGTAKIPNRSWKTVLNHSTSGCVLNIGQAHVFDAGEVAECSPCTCHRSAGGCMVAQPMFESPDVAASMASSSNSFGALMQVRLVCSQRLLFQEYKPFGRTTVSGGNNDSTCSCKRVVFRLVV